MSRPLLAFATLLAVAATAAPALADVLTLKDGTTLEGDVKRTDLGYDVRMPDGTVRTVPTDRVASIAAGKAGVPGAGTGSAPGAPTAESIAADRLASLRRSVEPLRDIVEIIARYQRFIDQNPGTPASQEAQADLKTWQDRRDRGLVKIAGSWVTPDEARQMRAQVAQIVQQARAALAANDLQQAEDLSKRALEIDPANAGAAYLIGVISYREDKLLPARKAFEQALASAPNHPATLNNLGVIAWRQNQYVAALNFYDQAMQAMPANKEILNNVAEALNAINTGTIKSDIKRQPVVAKVARRFSEQDARLGAVMGQYGWYRWGATWVDQPQLDRLKDAEKQVRAKMDEMQRQFDETRAKVQTNAQLIDDKEQAIKQMETNRWWRDSRGFLHQMDLPAAYYDYVRDRDALVAENGRLNAQLDSMRAQAKTVEQQLPTPKYTGVQQLIGPEGTPPPSAPDDSHATPPSTRP